MYSYLRCLFAMSMLWAVCNAHILSKIFAIQQPGVNIAVQMGHIRHLILVHQAGVYLGHIAAAQIEHLATAPAPMCRVIAGATQHQNAQNVVQYTHLYRPAYQAVIALTVWQCNIIKNRENPGFFYYLRRPNFLIKSSYSVVLFFLMYANNFLRRLTILVRPCLECKSL